MGKKNSLETALAKLKWYSHPPLRYEADGELTVEEKDALEKHLKSVLGLPTEAGEKPRKKKK